MRYIIGLLLISLLLIGCEGQSKIEKCKNITDDSQRDNCFADIVLLDNDFSVCPLITNKYLKESCFALAKNESIEVTE